MFKTTNQNQQPTLEAKIKLYLFFYIFFIYTLFILIITDRRERIYLFTRRIEKVEFYELNFSHVTNFK